MESFLDLPDDIIEYIMRLISSGIDLGNLLATNKELRKRFLDEEAAEFILEDRVINKLHKDAETKVSTFKQPMMNFFPSLGGNYKKLELFKNHLGFIEFNDAYVFYDVCNSMICWAKLYFYTNRLLSDFNELSPKNIIREETIFNDFYSNKVTDLIIPFQTMVGTMKISKKQPILTKDTIARIKFRAALVQVCADKLYSVHNKLVINKHDTHMTRIHNIIERFSYETFVRDHEDD